MKNSDSKFIRLLSWEILTDEEKNEFCKYKIEAIMLKNVQNLK